MKGSITQQQDHSVVAVGAPGGLLVIRSLAPSSPDLSFFGITHAVWSEIKRKACAIPHPNVESLKAKVEERVGGHVHVTTSS